MELTSIFALSVGLFSLLTNGTLLYILLRDPLKCFKSSTTYLIISLAVSDLLTGASACVFAFGAEIPPPCHTYLLSFFWITVQVSFLTLLAMSVERFLVVKYPIYSRVWISKKRVALSIAFIWLLSATLGGLILLPRPHLSYVQFSIFTEFFISVFLIAVLYSFILFGIRRSQKKVKGTGQRHQGGAQAFQRTLSRKTSNARRDTRHIHIAVAENSKSNEGKVQKTSSPVDSESPGHTPDENTRNEINHYGIESETQDKNYLTTEPNTRNFTCNESDESEVNTQGCRSSRRRFYTATQSMVKWRTKTQNSQQDKLTSAVCLLVGVLFLTVLPYILASQIIVGYSIFCHCQAPQALEQFHSHYLPIELLNFAVNPLVYAWRLPQYRRTLRYLCCKYKRRRDLASFRSASTRIRRERSSL